MKIEKKYKKLIAVIAVILLLVFSVIVLVYDNSRKDIEDSSAAVGSWTNLSSDKNQLPKPLGSDQQTASLVLDIDKDGKNDFVIASRHASNSVVWYRRTASGWQQYVIDSSSIRLEAGGDFFDIDGDGDLDISFGGDNGHNQLYWWENPYPNYAPTTNWTRHVIKNDGKTKHHDQVFGDVDGDGKTELVFWNQGEPGLFVAEIPANPKGSSNWPRTKIYTSTSQHEGLTLADIDGDGKLDIVGGGLWFKHTGGTTYTPQTIDSSRAFSRVAAGQLIKGGRPEVVFSAGDSKGTADLYSWSGSKWDKKKLFDADHGHSLQIIDIDKDGNLDIFSAEMNLNESDPDAKIRILYGDGNGNFTTSVVAEGYGVHEGRVADLDGDGDLDILAKPYNWKTPRIDVWLQGGSSGQPGGRKLDSWDKVEIGNSLDRRLLAVTAVDVDGDNRKDIVSSSYWWKQPANIKGSWTRNSVATNFNFVHAAQFDNDNKLDLLGTTGTATNSRDLVWAKSANNSFALVSNIAKPSVGDFPQGVAEIKVGNDRYIALSWHKPDDHNMQFFKINGESAQWALTEVSAAKSQNEDLSVGDIDGDGDEDIFQGTKWLRNNGAVNNWSQHTLDTTFDQTFSGAFPDRNVLHDFNGDGLLDAVVSLENGKQLIFYKNPGELASNPNKAWPRTVIYNIAGEGFSMDAGDIDQDGDIDIVVGEHKGTTENRVIILENLDKAKSDQASNWKEYVIDKGPKGTIDHHVGTQLIDIDNDGDLDLISIGWLNQKVWLYINTASSTGAPTVTASVVPPTNTPVPPRTSTPTNTKAPNTVVPSATGLQGNVCGKADIDGNGTFTIADFSQFASAYGNGRNTCADKDVNYGACGGRDVNRDGSLNIFDFGAPGVGFAQRYYPKTSCAL